MSRISKRVMQGSFVVLGAALILCGTYKLRAQDANALPNMKYQFKVGVLPFVDNTGSGGPQTGVSLGRAVQAELAHSSDLEGRVINLDEGVKPEDVDSEKAVAIGRDKHVDVVLVGTIIEATSESSSGEASGPSIFGQSLGGNKRSVKGTVTLQGDLYNTTTGQKIDSLRVSGKSSQTKVGANVSTTLGSMGTGGDFENSPLGKALNQAVANLVKQMSADESKFVRYNPDAGKNQPTNP